MLTGPVFLSCGCGQVNARWATISQNMKNKLPHGKPRSSKIIHDWLEQEGLFDKWPILKKHTYGIVVAHTDKGYEYTDIMTQTTTKTVSNIADLIERSTHVPGREPSDREA